MSDILQKALDTVAERGKTYGSPAKDFERVAALWSAYLGVPITAEQVPGCMILLKLSRLAQTPNHYDSILDVAGYAWCYKKVIEDEAMKALGDQP